METHISFFPGHQFKKHMTYTSQAAYTQHNSRHKLLLYMLQLPGNESLNSDSSIGHFWINARNRGIIDYI